MKKFLTNKTNITIIAYILTFLVSLLIDILIISALIKFIFG